jgi:hypothetical protein
MELSDWLYATAGRKHGIALRELVELLFAYLTKRRGIDAPVAAESLWRDYQRGGRSDLPPALKPYVEPADTRATRPSVSVTLPPRQGRRIASP